ncbi:hypothetical protein FNV43_RR26345 [Rhamnella rubrinervis]|uniref:Plant methyltransferase dimerisation domain-containing protein n=1 Tax=Rhamnella rubrinervis TaxID=2594499 RepID=A0A8K0DP49_9ROSA|nr:hypothetical protein FNV43_RR26345 [Rhamnella rubrinervis]
MGSEAFSLELEEEDFSYAMQLVSSSVLSMSLKCAMDLGVFDIIAKSGPGAKLGPSEIAANLPITNNPDAPSMLDCTLRLLANHSVLSCSVIEENGSDFHRLYGLLPVSMFFVTNKDGVSLCPLMSLTQDNVFLASCDEKCIELLRNCYKAIPENGKVIVMEAVVPIIPETSSAAKSIGQGNAFMMTQHLGGKERY